MFQPASPVLTSHPVPDRHTGSGNLQLESHAAYRTSIHPYPKQGSSSVARGGGDGIACNETLASSPRGVVFRPPILRWTS